MSEKRRIDVVQVELSSGTVVALDWDASQVLLEHVGADESMRPLIKEFGDVGTTRPLKLTQDQEGPLLHVNNTWTANTRGGWEGLPEDSTIFDVRWAMRRPATFGQS
jgi:hypothetical protein